MLCANDEMESHILGNVRDESIFDIWHGEKMNNAREIHIKHMGTKEIEPCKHWFLPRKMDEYKADLGDRLINIGKYVNRDQTVGK